MGSPSGCPLFIVILTERSDEGSRAGLFQETFAGCFTAFNMTLLCADKSNGAKAHSSGEINLPSSQVALSYRATVATDAKPRAEISLLNLCRGAKEENSKLTDANIPRRHCIQNDKQYWGLLLLN